MRFLKRLKGLNWATLASEHGSTQVWGSGVTAISKVDEILLSPGNTGQKPCQTRCIERILKEDMWRSQQPIGGFQSTGP